MTPSPTHLIRGTITHPSYLPTPPPPSNKAILNGHIVTPLSPGLLHAKQVAATGTRLYDPGFAHTLSCTSALTYTDGPSGILRHNGHPIESLAEHCEFLEVVHLLLYNGLPSVKQLISFRSALYRPRFAAVHADVRRVVEAFPSHAHPMGVLVAALAAVGTAHPELNPAVVGGAVYNDPVKREEAILTAIGVFPALIAGIFRHGAGLAPAFLELPAVAGPMSFAERFLRLLGGPGKKLDMDLVKTLDMLLLLHADHEQNCSTATVRQLSSSGVDLFSALAGGVAALYGPLHGGANEAVLGMLARIGGKEGVEPFLQRVKRREEKLMGFGHRVYKNYDPRARIVHERARMVSERYGSRDGLIEVAVELERVALGDEWFAARKLFPNVDFYSGMIYKAIGFEPRFFTVLFALGRVAGWVAQWKEFLDDPDRRIARPHQRYVGRVGPVEVKGIAERAPAGEGVSDRAVRDGFMVSKL